MKAPIIKLDQLEFNRDLRHGDRFDSGTFGAIGGRQPDNPQATFSARRVGGRSRGLLARRVKGSRC